MRRQIFWFIICLVSSALLCAQSGGVTQRSRLRGPGPSGENICSIEVRVSGSADLLLTGDMLQAFMSAGSRPPNKFDCSADIPANSDGVSLQKGKGRGTVTIGNDLRNTNALAVHIEDDANGADTYAFDLTWSGKAVRPGQKDQPSRTLGRTGSGGDGQGISSRIYMVRQEAESTAGGTMRAAVEDATRACEQQVIKNSPFGNQHMIVHGARVIQKAGRTDAVAVGQVDVSNGNDFETHEYSCAIEVKVLKPVFERLPAR